MPELIKVGMADYKVGRAPDTLISYGLGSCIGISLYDPQTKIGGLLHIMLPDSNQSRANENRAKFADTGSQMFAFANASDIMRVGLRNASASKEILKKLSIPIVGEDTGGNYGRTVQIDLSTGVYKVKTIDKGDKEI